MIEAPPEPWQLLPVQEYHEIGEHWVAVHAARADLPHQIHAHGVAAEGKERGVAQTENAAVAPNQIDRERQDRVAEILSDERQRIRREMERRRRRRQLIRHRRQDCRCHQQREQGRAVSIAPDGRPPGRIAHGWFSAARPVCGNKPRGQRWMKRIRVTSSTILAITAPA